MANSCGGCRHGHEARPGGGKPSPGTVWCGQRNMQMGKCRQMPCFIASSGRKAPHCVDCKRARMLGPLGETPRPGNVWCEKRRMEANKQRSMECFE